MAVSNSRIADGYVQKRFKFSTRRNSLSNITSSRKSRKPSDFINTLYDAPLLRGKIHIILLVSSPWWAGKLMNKCNTTVELIAAAISVFSCVFNFAISSMLHNIHWVELGHRTFWRQLDHLGIFAMIAGSAAPVPILTFSRNWLVVWLISQAVCLVMGGVTCFSGDGFSNKKSYAQRASVYVVAGLINLAFTIEFSRVLISREKWLLFALASCYIIGAAAYGTKKPNPWPMVFGYHECFHTLCLIASILTYFLNASVILRTG